MNAWIRGGVLIFSIEMSVSFAFGVDAETLLRSLQAELLPAHPLVLAARHQVERAQASLAGVDGYFDSDLHASAGAASWIRPLPGSSLNSGLGANRVVLQAGIEQAVLPGFFLSAGVAGHYLLEAGGRDRDGFLTLAGIQAAVPLLQNRSHAVWKIERSEAVATAEAARQTLREVLEQLRLETDSAWIDYYQAVADEAAYRLAGERVQALLEETEALVSLQAVPAYQLYPSRMDHALRKEEMILAGQRIESARLRLQVLFGELPFLPDAEALPVWADIRLSCGPPSSLDWQDAALRSGTLSAQRARVEAARAVASRARDALRPDLRFTLGVSWQGESADGPFGNESLEEDDATGVEAAFVLQVPLQRRRDRAAVQGGRAQVSSELALLEQQERLLRQRLEEARIALDVSRRRLEQVGIAAENARLTLEAESERFRLGEGRSRNVLDAQKDLTTTELRRNAAAAAFLRALVSYDSATAYPGGILPGADSFPAARQLVLMLAE